MCRQTASPKQHAYGSQTNSRSQRQYTPLVVRLYQLAKRKHEEKQVLKANALAPAYDNTAGYHQASVQAKPQSMFAAPEYLGETEASRPPRYSAVIRGTYEVDPKDEELK